MATNRIKPPTVPPINVHVKKSVNKENKILYKQSNTHTCIYHVTNFNKKNNSYSYSIHFKHYGLWNILTTTVFVGHMKNSRVEYLFKVKVGWIIQSLLSIFVFVCVCFCMITQKEIHLGTQNWNTL